MKTRLLIAFTLLASMVTGWCANPSLENFDQLYFKTNAPAPGIIQTRMNTNQFRSPVLPGDTWTITNVTGLTGASHWTNVAGVLQPVDGSSVLVTNLTATSNTVNVGTMTWLSKSIVLTNGVNYLPSGKYSQLQLISPSTDPSVVQIVLSNGWNTVQHLEIFNLTNAVPSQGAFTLTNLTPIPDSLGGGVVKLINGENWVATNGCGLELRFISPDWVEQFRSDVSGNPTFISNTFNNITVISNTTLRGRITINNVSITTNTLWTTNVVAGVINLQPVDLTEQPMVKNGWFVGTNSQTLWGSALGSDWALVSVADATKGEGGRGLSIASTDGNFSTNYSQITLSTVTNTAGLTLLSSDGSNDSVVSLQSQQATGGGGVLDIKFGGTNFVHIEPGITNGSPIAQFGSSITHSTGNIFELANNTTNRVVVTPLSTLIGSPITSPNFSVPAALQVSNFQDRGKALTVDIKLGASGNNDDYPVYFYSQITNSSAHPTINMEEVSPSGYIGGAHTLLSVQETPKVTNTVSTWPTYAAASTTAGYFNAAPTGGTNGAAMGLQGSVDPTRNFINIGVGSYVESTTDNLAATNIAFSGTVNQVLGTQKAVGGLFEIGSLANIPAIPSSAGVLIDGHNSGAPLIIAQTNGAVQMKVNANSGYDGTGNLFLSSDGTYKAAGGGSTIWSNTGGGNLALLDGASNIFQLVNTSIATNHFYALFGGVGPTNVSGSVVDLIGIGDFTLDSSTLSDTDNGIWMGHQAGQRLNTDRSYELIGIGENAMQDFIGSFANNDIAIGTLALHGASQTGVSDVIAIGQGTLDSSIMDGQFTKQSITAIGLNAGKSSRIYKSSFVTLLGDGVGTSTVITNSSGTMLMGSSRAAFAVTKIADTPNTTGIGTDVLAGASLVDSSSDNIFIGHLSGQNSILSGCFDITAIGGTTLSNSSVTNSDSLTLIGNTVAASITGTFVDAVAIGSHINPVSHTVILGSSTTTNTVLYGTTNQLTATGGIASLATDIGSISSTGWTNSLGKDADVAFDATSLIYKLADNAGTFWYTNTTAVGQGFIHLQSGGKFVLVSGSGLVGRYHAH